MIRRAMRLSVLAAAVLVAALCSGSIAVAGDHDGDGQGSGEHSRRCDKSCRDRGYSAWDEEWLMMSIQGDLFEIQGGTLAQSKGTTEKVRRLGARLVRDPTKPLHETSAP